jgi:hypothetical protein
MELSEREVTITMSPELQSAARSLRRWTLAAAVLFMGLLMLWFCFLVGQGVSVLATAVEAERGYEVAAGFAFGLLLGGTFLAMLIGAPAWLLWMGYCRASDSLRTQRVQPLARSIVWVRRFLVYCTVLLLCYFALALIITVVDLGRMLNV